MVRVLGMSMPMFTFLFNGAENEVAMRVYEVPVMRLPLRPDDLAIVGRAAASAKSLAGAHVEEAAGASSTDIVWVAPKVIEGREEFRSAALSWVTCSRERIKRKLLRYGPRFTGVQTAQKYVTWME